MADPLSILGATAAAVQLAEEALKVLGLVYDLYTDIRDAPEIISRRVRAIDHLTSLSRLIIGNVSLQKDSIATVLSTILREAGKLTEMLQKMKGNRVKQALTMNVKEKDVLAIFDELERAKSLLTLCIQEIDSGALYAIGMKVDLLPGVSEKVTTMHDHLLPSLMEQLQIANSSLKSVPEMKRYYNVPNRRVRNFIGREDILDRIKDAFVASEDTTRIVVLRGMGGQGKTQIALEYCRRMRDNYSAVFWVDATSEPSVRKGFEAIADQIKSDNLSLDDTDVKVAYALRSLGEWQETWLIVMDNHDDPIAFNNIQEYFPDNKLGCVLVTSRHLSTEALTDDKAAIELHGLKEEEALELLLKQSKISIGSTGNDLATASAVFKRLGYHALAIDQAGSYIRKRRITLDDFLKDYDVKRKTVLTEAPLMSQYRRKLHGFEQASCLTVFTTCELSFQQLFAIEDENHPISGFLTLIALFDCAPFSEKILHNYWKHLDRDSRKAFSSIDHSGTTGECDPLEHSKLITDLGSFMKRCFGDINNPWNTGSFVDMISTLQELSLIQSFSRDADGFVRLTLHPLIQDWIRLRNGSDLCMRLSIWAAQILKPSARIAELDPFVSSKKELLPYLSMHNANCTQYFGDEVITSLTFRLWTSITIAFSIVQLNADHPKDAEETVRQAFRILQTPSANHQWLEISVMKRLLARALQQQGKDFEARNLLWEALDDLSDFHEETTKVIFEREMVMRDLGRALMIFGEYKQAEAIFNDLLTVLRDDAGEVDISHPWAREILDSLGNTLQSQGRLGEAESLLRLVCDKEKPWYSLDDSRIRSSLFTLGCIFSRRGKYADAENIFNEVSKAEKQYLAENHKDVLFTKSMLAQVWLNLGQLDMAETAIATTLSLQRTVLGPQHPGTLDSCIVMAKVLMQRERYDEARNLCHEAVKRLLKSYGPKNVSLLTALQLQAQLVPLPEDNGNYEQENDS